MMTSHERGGECLGLENRGRLLGIPERGDRRMTGEGGGHSYIGGPDSGSGRRSTDLQKRRGFTQRPDCTQRGGWSAKGNERPYKARALTCLARVKKNRKIGERGIKFSMEVSWGGRGYPGRRGHKNRRRRKRDTQGKKSKGNSKQFKH